MDFFNNLINDVTNILPLENARCFSYNSAEQWQEDNHSTVLMLRETAYELTGVGFNLVTQNAVKDEILLIGKNLSEIKENTPFARVCLVSVLPQEDEQMLYNLIRKIEYVKYKFFPVGYMIRSSSDSQKEAIRVSKKAVSQGLNFEKIGSLLIKKFKSIPEVQGVKIIYITDESVDFKALQKMAEKGDGITKTLNHIMNSVSFDCDSCGLKAICDEVEGMKELHFKKVGM